MSARVSLIVCLALAVLVGAALPAAVADEAVDKAFEALKTYDWGNDRNLLKPIDDAVVASHKDAAARKALETRLAAVLKTDAPRAAKDYVCRELSLIGTAECVPTVAPLLSNAELSHMARFVLERVPAPEAAKALRDALGSTGGKLKVGVINSLGSRRDAASADAMVALLGDSDKEIAAAACAALGAIGTPEAAKALGDFQAKAPKELRLTAADAYLGCAERLLADGKKAEATGIYKALSTSDIPHVRRAAMQGMLAAAGKK